MFSWINSLNLLSLTGCFFLSWCGWIYFVAGVRAEDVNSPSPISEIERIGESLDVERSREKALSTRAHSLTSETISIGKKVRQLKEMIKAKEGKILAIREELRSLESLSDASAEATLIRQDALVSSVVALLVIQHRAKPTLLLSPHRQRQARLRSVALAAVAGNLANQKTSMNVDFSMLEDLRIKQARETKSLVKSKSALEDQRGGLELLLHRKSSLQAIILSERKKSDEKLARLAAKAEDLQQLLKVLESPVDGKASALNSQITESDNFSKITRSRPNGSLLPAVDSYLNLGQVVNGFGTILENGLDSQGLFIDVLPDSDVICLRDGKVVFSGIFRTYGQLLIIQHGQGYHSLLSGFARIYGEVGDFVRAGEPVGVMGGAASKGSVLYVEMRRQGAPMNPIGWLDLIDREVKG